jgi:hypothetical protein
VGNFFLSELISFMRFDAMGPLAPPLLDGQTSTMNQAYLHRAVYVSVYDPASTAQDREDPGDFASKMQRALGAGGSFLMKRNAIEIADFERDLQRLKDISKDFEDFGRLFREFWDKDEDKELSPGDMWEKTRNIRYQGLTFWKLPVLQLLNLAKGTTIDRSIVIQVHRKACAFPREHGGVVAHGPSHGGEQGFPTFPTSSQGPWEEL